MKKSIPYLIYVLFLPFSIAVLILSCVGLLRSAIHIQKGYINSVLYSGILASILCFLIFLYLIRVVLYTYVTLKDNSIIISQIGVTPSKLKTAGYHFSMIQVIDEVDLNSIVSFGYAKYFPMNKSKIRYVFFRPIYFEKEDGTTVLWETGLYSKKQLNDLKTMVEEITEKSFDENIKGYSR